jgi:MoaA/NifB/PqqE/SkfB family radical SAM enzyme
MSAIFAWPAELSWRDRGVALTLVVPATDCNLACGFCAIRQRGEAAGASLRPEDFVAFVDGVARTRPAAMVSLQGYEPLLAEAWPYTVAILEKARSLGLPRSLVTNGILLEDRARDLAELDPTGVTVSIDSASAEHHDRLRGREGALEPWRPLATSVTASPSAPC